MQVASRVDGRMKLRDFPHSMSALLISMLGNSLSVQWLGPHTFTASGLGSIVGQSGTRVSKLHNASKLKNKGKKKITVLIF